MTTLKEYYEQGLTLEEYVNQMKVNKAVMHKIYETFELPDDPRLAVVKDKHLKAIVITEDWCGDAMMNLPILMKIAEQTDMQLKVCLRDENLELMDQYLTNGTARAIPIFVFLDEQDYQYAVWGPRAQEVQDFVTDARKDLPEKDAADFEEKQKAVHHEIHEKYKNTPEFWNNVYESIMTNLVL